MFDLAFRNQLLHHARDILDGHLWIDAMLEEQIDVVGTQTSKAAIDSCPDMFRAAIGATAAFAGLGINVKAKLRRDDYLVAHRRQCLANKVLVDEWSVGFG